MLEALEKLSKIVFVGIASTVIAVAGLGIEWSRLGLDEDSWCFEHSDRAQTALLQRTETIPGVLIERYSSRCDVSIEQATRIIHEDRVIAELTDAPSEEDPSNYASDWDRNNPDAGQLISGGEGSPNGPEGNYLPNAEPETVGFVALGRVAPTSFSQVNFNDAVSGEPSISRGFPPAVNTLLTARWSVNLRGNTSNTTQGGNPILLVIGEGECVKIVDEPEIIRGQYWAAVSLEPCGS